MPRSNESSPLERELECGSRLSLQVSPGRDRLAWARTRVSRHYFPASVTPTIPYNIPRPDDCVSKVLGKDHPGCVRCLGLGGLHSVAFRSTTKFSNAGKEWHIPHELGVMFGNVSNVIDEESGQEMPTLRGGSSLDSNFHGV
ncbi:hypothetical protein DEO72_LG10g1497 [Vigna unguiculata]|uniref:Uncharacterized protein n=1 Tax=Vigna unguiculata TaxID=3917 RepID=A0A4D6NCK6_VIGUN|nr:hypothetical protein DEO72_LG10g1497 [Vigna unguiculata]